MRKTIVFSLLASVCLSHPAQAAAELDASGGVILSSAYSADRREAALCENCHWHFESGCDSDANCMAAAEECRDWQHIARVWRANATSRPAADSGLWHLTGYTCAPTAGPLTLSQAQTALAGLWQSHVPELIASTRPPYRTLLHLPVAVKFGSGYRVSAGVYFSGGVALALRAEAVRMVSCPDIYCRKLGPRRFVFDAPRWRRLRVTASWSGKFDALGISGLPVEETAVEQAVTIRLRVRSAERRLVATK